MSSTEFLCRQASGVRPKIDASRWVYNDPLPRILRMSRPPTSKENAEHPRLSKRMGELGLCSRREADRWIESGWVKVDGQVVDTLGVRVSPDARIEVDRAAREHQSGQVTILLHKPVGYVSGQAEDGYEPAIVLIRPENRWSADPSPIKFQREHLRSLVPAGRLDIDSTGLLVLTQDGRIAKQLIGEDSSVEKEYLVRVEGTLTADGMKRLQHGLTLDGVKLKPAQVRGRTNTSCASYCARAASADPPHVRARRPLRDRVEASPQRNVALGGLPVGKWRYLGADEKF